jgi:hypothetical protein
MEKAAAWKSPKSGLSHYAWKSRRSGGISHFSHSSGGGSVDKQIKNKNKNS